MKDQIIKLKIELMEILELSKYVTPKPWVKGWNIIGNGKDTDVCLAPMRNPSLTVMAWPTDAAFIARSRNISPAMAECLLVAVENLELMHEQTDLGEYAAWDALQQILNIWEETK
jgi:hypothetical protein